MGNLTLVNIERDQEIERLRVENVEVKQERQSLTNSLFNNITTKATGTVKLTSRQEFCLSNKCVSLTEFILFGLGTVLLGVIGGVAAISYVRKKCLMEEEAEVRHTKMSLDLSDLNRDFRCPPPLPLTSPPRDFSQTAPPDQGHCNGGLIIQTVSGSRITKQKLLV